MALTLLSDNSNDRHEISIESPRRDDSDDDRDREKRRPKKKSTKRRDEDEEEEVTGIYALLAKKDQPKSKPRAYVSAELDNSISYTLYFT